jgi:hypothetical protein
MSAIKNMSLFVPHIFPNFNQQYVIEAFSELGYVSRVDFVSKIDRDGKLFNAAYIHFDDWKTDKHALNTLTEIEKNGSFKFYHDDSDYYWIVLPNTAKKHIPGNRKSRIDLGENKSITTYKTPEKPLLNQDCPNSPKKLAFQEDNDDIIHRNSDAEFEEFDSEASEEAAQMAEIEAFIEEEDQYLVSIDSRYVQVIERENVMLHEEIAKLRIALINLDQIYQAEKAKVKTFSNVETSIEL